MYGKVPHQENHAKNERPLKERDYSSPEIRIYLPCHFPASFCTTQAVSKTGATSGYTASCKYQPEFARAINPFTTLI
jgi:hypothetical protein